MDDFIYILTTTKISKGMILNLLTSALEGGSNYWYFIPENQSNKFKNLPGEFFVEKMVNYIWQNDNIVDVHDLENEDEKIGEFSFINIKKGLDLMQQNSPLDFADFLTENDDASTADTFFQYIVLGELTFG